jgi:uncharacterized protein DUF6885
MVTLLPGADRLLAEQAVELPQKDDLCGAFWGLVALRAAGRRAAPGGAPLDQDAVALAAGTVLSPPPRTSSLPPGEIGRGDFRLALPVASEGAAAGTSAGGLARAVAELSGGALAAVPATGAWDRTRLLGLLARAATSPASLAVLANLATGALWDPGVRADQIARYLESGDDAAPSSTWQVGHYVAVIGYSLGRRGSLVTIADSYRSRGPAGVLLQTSERFAAALRRDGEQPAGLLLVVAANHAEQAQRWVNAAGLTCALWDNGSPDART